jgi:hypothetical protein
MAPQRGETSTGGNWRRRINSSRRREARTRLDDVADRDHSGTRWPRRRNGGLQLLLPCGVAESRHYSRSAEVPGHKASLIRLR